MPCSKAVKMDLNRAACELLDIPETDDALSLLGIARDRLDIPAIKAGLGRRLSQIAIHPTNCEEDTQEIREYLKGIAAELCTAAAPQAGDPKRYLKLTALDKRIIATLVAQGGWNQKKSSSACCCCNVV